MKFPNVSSLLVDKVGMSTVFFLIITEIARTTGKQHIPATTFIATVGLNTLNF